MSKINIAKIHPELVELIHAIHQWDLSVASKSEDASWLRIEEAVAALITAAHEHKGLLEVEVKGSNGTI